MDKICFKCKKPIEVPYVLDGDKAIRLTQVGNKDRVEYIHSRCLDKIRRKQTDDYVSNILSKFLNGEKVYEYG